MRTRSFRERPRELPATARKISKEYGAPPVQILNRLAQIRALLLRLNYTARPCD
jgi:hypothetical protein